MKQKFLAWKGRLLRLLKPPRSLRFTRLGYFVVFLTLGIGFGAMNTGNNLVYMIFGMMLGLITASGILSEMSLRGLDVDWIFPAEMSAGKLAAVRMVARNAKDRLPTFAVRISFRSRRKLPAFPEAPAQSHSAFFAFIPAQSQRSCDLLIRNERRGEFEIEELKIETVFPFGFFRKYLTREPGARFLVYPSIEALNGQAGSDSDPRSQQSSPQRGPGENFWGLKDFSPGDNPRRISWKSSAKRDRLMVLETEREMEKRALLSLEPLAEWKRLNEAELESALSFAASLASAWFHEGRALGLIGPGIYVPPSLMKRDLARILTVFALLDPGAFPPGLSRLQHALLEKPVEVLPLWRSLR